MIMKENLKMKSFNNSMKNMEFIIIFLVQELLNIIVIYIRPILKKTPYELWNDRQPNISYFHHFKSDCFILNTKYNLGKFHPKSNKGTFRYSTMSKAYRILRNVEDKVRTQSTFKDQAQMDLLSKVEPKNIEGGYLPCKRN
ncbi:hypothetical protein CR513_04717, partial [Mucuna pruriens]